MSDGDIAKIIDDAFNGTPVELTYRQTDAEAKETKLFCLKSTAYYNLQAYLTLGMTLPSSVERFESDFPRAELRDLTDLDSLVWDELKNCFVDIFNHCNDFSLHSLGKFVTITANILTFCDDAARYIGGRGLLKDQLAIVTADGSDPQDPAFQRASKISQALLERLAKQANAREVDCKDLVSDLTKFLKQTQNDQKAADNLYRKFISPGPDPANGKKPYAEVLQETLAQLRKEAIELSAAEKRHREEWAQATIVAVTSVSYIWIFPFGTIAGAVNMGVHSKKAADAMEAFQREAAALLVNEDKQKSLTRCVDHVTNICCELTNIEAVISKAIEAIQGIQSIFGRLSANFRSIQEKLASISTTIQDEMDFIRALANVDLDVVVARWAETKIVALDFMTNAPIEWKGGKPV